MTSPIVSNAKLNALHSRLSAEQRKLIMQAADADMLPASSALRHIASLEGMLGAVDAVLDEREGSDMAPLALPIRQEKTSMATGTVKWFNATKGYGFIAPDTGGTDVFVHISAVERAGMRELYDGQKIAYEIKADAKTGKSSADQLKAVE